MARSSRSGFALRSDPRVKYSKTEMEIFALLGRRRQTSVEIADRHYGANGAGPYHGQKIVSGLLRSLVEKTEHNRESFRINHTRRMGPHPMAFWLEER